MGTKKYLQRLTSQSGDTIVEVLLCLTVLGLVVGTASVLATRNTNTLQTTKEDAVALRVAQGQIEYLKSFAATNWGDIASGNICMKDSKTQAPSGSGCVLPDPSGGAAEYQRNITLTKVQTADDAYILAKSTVTWETPKSPGKVEVTYKIYKNVTAEEDRRPGGTCGEGQIGNPGTGCTQVPPQVRAKVQKIKPNSNQTTPPCNSTNYENKSGVQVRLQGGSFNQVQPNSSSNSEAIFQDASKIVPGTSYTATITSVPPRYEICNGTAQTGTLSTAGTVFSVNPVLTIRPVCYLETHYTAPYDHYSAPYNHYSAPYHHYTAPYDHGYWQGYWSHSTNPDYSPDGYFPNSYGDAFQPNGDSYYTWYSYSNLYPGYSWYLGYSLLYGWVSTGYYADYLGYYSDYLGYYGDYLGYYGDPYPANVCP